MMHWSLLTICMQTFVSTAGCVLLFWCCFVLKPNEYELAVKNAIVHNWTDWIRPSHHLTHTHKVFKHTELCYRADNGSVGGWMMNSFCIMYPGQKHYEYESGRERRGLLLDGQIGGRWIEMGRYSWICSMSFSAPLYCCWRTLFLSLLSQVFRNMNKAGMNFNL